MKSCPYCAEEVKDQATKCRHCGEWLSKAARAHPSAKLCPGCSEEAGTGAQACGKCGKRFVLHLGPILDASLLLPAEEAATTYSSRSAGFITHNQADVTPDAIAYGPLDPITGMVPLGSSRIPYEDVSSITTWRRVDWWGLAMTILFLLPISVLVALAARDELFCGFPGLFFWPLTLFSLWRSVAVGCHFMRVCGTLQTLEFRYDRPFYRRKRFCRAALARAGITPTAELE